MKQDAAIGLRQYAVGTARDMEAGETAEHQPPRGPVPTGPRKKSLLQKTFEEKDQEYYPDSKLTAGGPGSGRKAGTGSIAPTPYHNMLVKEGFKHQNNQNDWATYHNDKTGVAAHVDESGNHIYWYD